MRKLGILILLFVFSASFASSMLGEIFVNYDGTADINLVTSEKIYNWVPSQNVIATQTSILTSKTQDIWKVGFSPEVNFTSYKINFYFPRGSTIYDVVGEHKIMYSNNRLVLEFSGQGQPKINIVYKIPKPVDYSPLAIIGIALLIAVAFYKKKPGVVNKYLSDTEKIVVNELQDNKKGLKQNELRYKTKLPKSTLSRTLKQLERKDIIVTEKVGITNMIRLK